jgi:two-component system, cell cycle sensor histidine kinase and response regulator CckA
MRRASVIISTSAGTTSPDSRRNSPKAILTPRGYRVLGAGHPEDALLLCEQHKGPIDLLFTDVVMPAMSGRQLAEKAGKLRPGLKVLCMSGYTDEMIGPHSQVSFEANFVQKPFSAEALLQRVRQVLDA